MKKTDVMAATAPWTTEHQPALVGKRNAKFCAHRHATVDRIKREVVCNAKDCGALLDPIEYLAQLARDGTDLLYTREELRRARAEIRELDAERTKLKSSVAGLKKRRGM